VVNLTDAMPWTTVRTVRERGLPGLTVTDMTRASPATTRPWQFNATSLWGRELSESLRPFLASDDASFITSVNLPVDGGVACDRTARMG
jgi:NAD(P)-dependent dehydrogenase (short-subunit alcohol dehydrogenase family)